MAKRKEEIKEEKTFYQQEWICPKCGSVWAIWDMLFDSFPPDMENLSTMTPEQAYRLLKNFIKKLENYTQTNN